MKETPNSIRLINLSYDNKISSLIYFTLSQGIYVLSKFLEKKEKIIEYILKNSENPDFTKAYQYSQVNSSKKLIKK